MAEFVLRVKPKKAKRFQYLKTDSSLTSHKSDENVARFTQEDRAQARIDTRESENFPDAEWQIVPA